LLLEQAIFALPPQQRAVFNLRFYNNLPYEVISKILKKSVGGLKANYFHAIKKIEEFLKNKKSFNY
jgi:RNA polymerase sigma-70 factor (ECF subfamily)